MFKVKLFAAITLFGLLTSCSTTKQPTESEQKKIKTAKINAQLGIAYLEQNNIQRSKQKLMLALDQAPNIPETWYSMAYFFEATGNKDEARQYYLKALAIAPKRGDVQNNYGTFLCRAGDYNASIHQFLSAVQDRAYLDPADAYENAGLCALKIPDNERASHYFQQALNEDPTRPISLIKLAELNYKAGEYKNSEKLLSQYLDVSQPNEQSSRLGKLLVLKAHEGNPTEKPVQLAQEDKAEPLQIKKVTASSHKIASKKNVNVKSVEKLASVVKAKNIHPKLSKTKSSRLASTKHGIHKHKHKLAAKTSKKLIKKTNPIAV